MSRPRCIIAPMAMSLLFLGALSAQALDSLQPGYAAYEVRLEIARNGIHLGTPVTTVAAGEAATADLFAPARGEPIRISHRVSGFPGAEDSKVLLELELFRLVGDRARRMVAPTIGVDLGTVEQFEVATAQGLVTIRATVEGLADVQGDLRPGPRGIPYSPG